MKRERVLRGSLILSAIAFVLLGVTYNADAQGRYVGQYSRADVDNIIRRLETSGDDFRDNFNRELDRSNLSNSQKNNYRRQVESFENATDRLRSRFDSNNNWWESRSQVQALVTNARPLNVTMNSIGFRRNIERQWNRLRQDVNTLADTYDLPGIAGGGWTGGPGSGGGAFPPGGGTATRPPAWAQGTWYWMQGYGRTMNIASNGRVTLYNQGRTSYGTYNRGTIFVDGISSTVQRNGANIRTINSATGEISDYSRNDTGVGGGGGGGNMSRPPNWARGTWYWTGGPARRMEIENDGRITLFNQGRTSFGTYYNGTITIDGITSTVSRVGNGIRTYNQATGEVSDYRR